jgi:hypothetical protein
MNQRLLRWLVIPLTVLAGIAGSMAAYGNEGAVPGPTPTPSQSLSPSPTPDPCACPGASIDDFVMWDAVEGGVAEVPVHTRVPCAQSRTIVFSTYDITAKAGQDYVGVQQGTVVLRAGETRTVIRIRIIGDTLNEQTEHFGIRLLSGAQFDDGQALVFIQDR